MKYIIYCRKSTDTEDKQVLSLESQEQELISLAEKEQLEVIEIMKESMSAKEPGRPVFNKILRLLVAGKADGILCWKIDRLTRNPIDGGQIQWLLQTGTIKCIKTFEKSYYPSDNVLLINIEQAMATQYIRDLSINVKRGNRAKLERGEWPNRAPLGYLNDKATKQVIVNKKLSHYITRVFELYSTGGYTLKQITNELYKYGLRTASGNKIGKNQIHRIITSRFYCGFMERDGKVYPAKHKALVSLSLYNKVQDILKGRKHPRPKKHFYVARGLLSCAVCGCTLTADNKKGYSYYYCTNGKGHCEQHKRYLRAEAVDKLIEAVLLELKFELPEIELTAKAYSQKHNVHNQTIQNALDDLTKASKLLSEQELALVDGYTTKIIREEAYKTKMKELEYKRFELLEQIEEVKAKRHLFDITFEQVKTVFLDGNKAAELYSSSIDTQKRSILLNLLSNISIKDQKVLNYQLKSPYDLLAKVPKNARLRTVLALWDAIGKVLLASSPASLIAVDTCTQLREN